MSAVYNMTVDNIYNVVQISRGETEKGSKEHIFNMDTTKKFMV